MRFSVVDTGIGIAADKLGAIFEAFSQADQSTTRQFGGTGLGLAIARKLVAAMGGELKVESTVGIGTTFYFTVPTAPADSLGSWPRLAETSNERPRAVLCIEGQQTAAAATAYLEEAGFDVEPCLAETLARKAKGAAFVLATADRLAGDDRLPVAPDGVVVLLTRPDEDGREAIGAGIADAALSWPLLRADLAEIIECLRDGRTVRGAHDDLVGSRPSAARFVGLRVLVVDDSEVNREVAQAALHKLGVAPELADNGSRAVEAVLESHYDLVLMDGSMPGLDGFDATRLIRAREQAAGRARTPIVALTAHVIGTAADAWREAGMDGVLHKPFTLAGLVDCIRLNARGKDATLSAKPVALRDARIESTSLLDRSALEELRRMASGSPKIVNRIIRLYCTESAERVVELAEAIRANSVDRLGRAAHALKSMSFNVGARGIAEKMAEIEQAARVEGRLASPEDVEALEAQLADVRAQLEMQVA
ncbi:MAG: response regulator [Hyphomicrobiales bacterium]